MGGVYIGFDAETKQLVAIKTLFSEFSKDEGYIRRFQREAEVYKKLNHPNIVGFVHAGFENGAYYIAMEHIKGQELADIMKKNGPLGFDVCVKIMGHLADAMAHAHGHGVIHRDLKPQNIMITEDGDVKLLDFGIAQADDGLVNTVTGSIIGTFFYSSPEQNQGKKIDERSDLYSLGLIFYEMLTGDRALKGATLLEVTGYQMRSQIPAPSAHFSEIPAGIDKIVMKLLEKNPNNRYDSANDLIKDIHAFKDNPSFDPNTSGFDNEEIGEWWETAQQALLIRNFDRAIEFGKKVEEHKKDSPELYMLLGKAYAGNKVMSQAMDYLRRATQMEPDNFPLMLDHAIALYNLGCFKEAKQKFKDYLDYDSDDLYANRYLNLIKEDEEKKRKAEEEAAVLRMKALKKMNEGK
jgi:serine/threonine protein kinase